eukprot:s1724_g5.t1
MIRVDVAVPNGASRSFHLSGTTTVEALRDAAERWFQNMFLTLLKAKEETPGLCDRNFGCSPHQRNFGFRFRQRLFDANLAIMEDSMRFDIVPEKIQVVALAFNPCPTHQGIDTLVHAVQNKDLATVEAMLTAAVDPNAAADNGFKTPLQMAVVGKRPIVQLLLEAYADINAECFYKTTSLAEVSGNGNMDMVRFLVERGACVNASRPLCHAAAEGHPDVVRYLLEAGAEKDCRGYEGLTPLLEAVIESHYTVVGILLEVEVDVNAGSDAYWTPLMQAARTDLRMLIKLLDAAADVNRVDNTGETALLRAAEEEDNEAVKLLVEARADINMSTDDADTPLLLAVLNGNFRMVRYFIERGARVNQRTVDGGTVLHIAAEENQLDVVQLLLTGRADLQIRTSTGETALDAARRRVWHDARVARGKGSCSCMATWGEQSFGGDSSSACERMSFA